MASLYVHALTDVPLEAWVDDDGTIESIPVEGVFAICERRSASPLISEAELRRQHAIALRIADSVPAALPARFGSLVDTGELATILRDRRDVVQTALDRVRGHVQMNVRIAADDTGRRALQGFVGESRTTRPSSGRAYLKARLQQASVQVPPRARAALEGVRALVVDERTTSGAAGMVTVYHLIRRHAAGKYKTALTRADVPEIRVTGPWPAFAFVPDLWT